MDADTYLHALICLIPAFWIGFGFISRAVFMLKGYPTTEGLLVGLLFGPVGVIIGFLVPPYSKPVYRALRNFGLLFAFVAFNLNIVGWACNLGLAWSRSTGILFVILAECIIIAIGIYLIKKGKWR